MMPKFRIYNQGEPDSKDFFWSIKYKGLLYLCLNDEAIHLMLTTFYYSGYENDLSRK